MAAPTRRPTTNVADIMKYKPGDDSPPNRTGSGGSDTTPGAVGECTDNGSRRLSLEKHRKSPDFDAPIYGELIVLGTNGALPCQPISHKMKHTLMLRKQPRATGVSPIDRDPKHIESTAVKSTHTVTLAKSGHVTEYGFDPTTDLFQIGRSADSAIDMVVLETVTGADGKKTHKSNSTISRYACRIQCERSPPYSARIYAAAFDTQGKIKLSVMAPTWRNRSGEYDGLTTNGVAFMRPVGVFESGVSPGGWREVTVNGHVRKMREERSSRVPGEEFPEETNILTDGCLIDLCGVTLMWRTAIGLSQGPSHTILRANRHELNEKAPQCPVNFLTLHFRGQSTVPDKDEELRAPWVYIKCGHMYSYHEWKAAPSESNTKRTCPMCREAGPYVRLDLGRERAFFIDTGPLSHAFVPCGHITTKRTTEYWTSVQIPHLSNEWTSRCPFCVTPLDPSKPAIKLLFS